MTVNPMWATAKREIVDRYTNSSDLRGWLQLASVIIPVAALWAAVAKCAPEFVWLYPAATLLLSLFLLRGFVLMHDCGHDTLFRSSGLNQGCGFVLGVLAGLPQQVWAENHRYHHATNGNWERYRGPLAVACVEEYMALSEGQRIRYRRLRSILMSPIAGCLYFLVTPRLTWLRISFYLAQQCLTGGGRSKPPTHSLSRVHYMQMSANNLTLLAVWGLMGWWIGTFPFFACYFVSCSLAGAYGLILFSVQHNFEGSYASADEGWDRDEAAHHGTSFLVLPVWLNWFTADVGYHHVHHLCARVPNYRLAACHKEHEALFEDVKRIRLSQIPSALRHLLWDRRTRKLITIQDLTG